MSLFINNHNGPIYNGCQVTIHNECEQSPNDANVANDGNAANEAKSANDILPIPRENRYTEVRRYIEERKRFDAEFKTFCDNHSLRDLCKRLTNEFGWFVDEHSLGANLNRNR